ncbi:MAG TPA: class I adenylate-forming enzyme family protein [Acidimicrobiales bacterium]|nr:class I adenylate-forming enzyme family protein [Acidimicrobiales bacterium]
MSDSQSQPTMSLEEANAILTAPGQMFEIGQETVRGIPTRVWKSAPPTLAAVLELSRAHGDKTFLVYEDERTTFEEHYRQAAALAGALIERYGVGPGDRVAIAMRNFPEWAVAFWATAAAGAVVVPLNAWWTADELTYGLEDSGSKVLFADWERLERLAEDLPRLDISTVVARAEDEIPAGTDRFEQVVAEAEPVTSLPDTGVGPEDDATIFYTSGTTGRPKGAVGTHRNICTNLMSLFFVAARGGLRAKGPDAAPAEPGGGRQNAYLLSVPLFHATGCHSILVANTAAGGKLVMMHRWNPERALELIEREQITTFGGVPAMVMQVLDSPDFDKRDTSSVTSIGYGGAPAPPELVRRIKQHFPVGQPSNGYGLTETSSVTTMNSGDDYVRRPDSVGPPVPVVEVKVVDDEGRELPVGAVGELWIKGPNVVRGYWNKPEATAETFTDGWLHSGDVARIDEDGFVYIVDRAKDMVIRGGENVYCVEVEAVLYEHPAVADAAVIGIPHEVLGEEVGAVVQLRPGATATEEELRRHVATKLAAFKVPVKIWFRDEELPRNPAGKILKRELKAELIGS